MIDGPVAQICSVTRQPLSGSSALSLCSARFRRST